MCRNLCQGECKKSINGFSSVEVRFAAVSVLVPGLRRKPFTGKSFMDFELWERSVD